MDAITVALQRSDLIHADWHWFGDRIRPPLRSRTVRLNGVELPDDRDDD